MMFMKPNKVYVSVDGDNIGDILEKHLINNNLDSAKKLSQSILEWIDNLSKFITDELNGEILIKGGDSLLCTIEEDKLNLFIKKIKEIQKNYPFTCSVGVGKSCRESFLALKIAKAKGRNHIQIGINEG